MAEATFTSEITAGLVDSMASDNAVVRAARVSTIGAAETAENIVGDGKLIEFLMKNRHGSPFEHAVFTFLVRAPIFVFRELMRHRIASYNEESGRYKELEGRFYAPDALRPLVQVGKAGAYEFVDGTEEQRDLVANSVWIACTTAYQHYQHLLEQGIAREVARMVLPVNTYSSAYVTINARSLMNVLSLRTKDPRAAYPSFPQAEIEMMAVQMQTAFQVLMPLTYGAFNKAGRVAP